MAKVIRYFCTYANGKGTVYVDSAQLEHNSYATTYNQLYGGSMENPSQGWKPQSGTVTRTDEQSLDGGYSLRLDSTADSSAIATMNAYIVGDRDTRETLTLSGWGEAPSEQRPRQHPPHPVPPPLRAPPGRLLIGTPSQLVQLP